MTRNSNDFEGQIEGTPVTPTNSATSGVAFSTVSTGGTGGTITYAAAAAHGAGMGFEIVFGATGDAGYLYAPAAPATARTRVTCRTYASWTDTASPTARSEVLIGFRTTSGGVTVGYVALTALGEIQLQDQAKAPVATGPVLSPDVQYRIEAAVTPGTGTTDGAFAAAVYVGDSTSPVWQATGTGDAGTAAITVIRLGRPTGTTYGARRLRYDDLAIDDALPSGWIGVAVPLVAVVVNATSSPPQIEITISTPDGSAMTAVTLYRQIGGIRTPTRVQPSPGLASRFITDPETPWDTPVAYVATMSYGAGGASSITGTSPQVILTPSPAAIWAIHPTVPSRSVPLDQGRFDALGIAVAGDLVYRAQATQHPIIGSKVPLLTKVGTRAGASWSLDLTSTTLDERTRLLALVDDETPLLIRAPAAWGWGLDEGYYAVGDVGELRRLQYGPDPTRTVRLPLTKVAAPAGAQQSSWSWGGLMAGYADWRSVQAAYADWNAVAGNNPS